VLENALDNIRDVLTKVDDDLIAIIVGHSDKTVSGILIITIVCSAVVIIASSIILPFLFKLDISSLKMLEMTLNIKSQVKDVMVKRISKFEAFISSNKFLSSYYELY
jgi:hypothetical protein